MPDPLDIRTGQPLDYETVRFVRPIRSDNIARVFGDPDVLIDLYRGLEEQRDELVRMSGYGPSLSEKLGEVFGSDFGAGLYIGILAGALFTVIAAYVIAFGDAL